MLNADPKMLLFTLARYKFVAKMMSGLDTVLKIGCQEAWGLPLVAQNVKSAHGIDFYIPYIDSCCSRITESGKTTNMTFGARDILDGSLPHKYDGVFALGVLEHISQADEDLFIRNALRCLAPHGTLILGMPSRESQAYASEVLRLGHVNCKTGPEFVAFARRYFNNVGTFCMNDEVLHTGVFPYGPVLANPVLGRQSSSNHLIPA